MSARYVSPKTREIYIEIKPDGTFYKVTKELVLGVYMSNAVSGKYRIEGNILTLVLPTGKADRGKIEGDVYIDGEGTKWIKENPRMLTDSEKLEKAKEEILKILDDLFKSDWKHLEELPKIIDPWGNDYRIYIGANINGHYGISDVAPDEVLIVSLGPLGKVENWRFDKENPAAGFAGTRETFKGNLICLNGAFLRDYRGN